MSELGEPDEVDRSVGGREIGWDVAEDIYWSAEIVASLTIG